MQANFAGSTFHLTKKEKEKLECPRCEMRRTSSGNWILVSCQRDRVTSRQSNSGHKQTHIFKLFSLYLSALCQVSLHNQSLRKHKTYTNTQTSDTNFRRVSPFNITPVKRAHKARTCWYRRPFPLIYRYQVKEKYKKGMDRHNTKFKNII